MNYVSIIADSDSSWWRKDSVSTKLWRQWRMQKHTNYIMSLYSYKIYTNFYHEEYFNFMWHVIILYYDTQMFGQDIHYKHFIHVNWSMENHNFFVWVWLALLLKGKEHRMVCLRTALQREYMCQRYGREEKTVEWRALCFVLFTKHH